MSYYKLFQVDIIQASQLYLGGGVNAGLPAPGLTLLSDGAGGTFWSSVSGGGTTNAITSTLLASTVDGLGSAGYASTTYVTQTISSLSTLLGPAIAIGVAGSGPGGALTNSNLQSTVIGLGNFYISTNQVGLGNIVSFAQLYSTVAGITSNTNALSSQTGLLTSSGFVSTYSLASTVVGLATSGYISTSQLTSTIVGLGNLYVSVNNVMFSPNVAVGLSTNYISSGLSYLGGVTINSNTLNALNTPFTMGFTSNPGQNPITINAPVNSLVNMVMNSGTSNSLLLGVNQTSANITSSNNPLILTGSLLTALTSTLTVQPTLLSNNNTQIIGSTISTGIVLANLFSGYYSGDGSLLTNLNAISSLTLTAYTQSTMVSTVKGLNNYLGYLSVNAIGPVVTTSSLITSTLLTRGSITAGGIALTNAFAPNYWVATGAAATCNATLEWSTDGLNWRNASSGGFSVQAFDTVWNNTLWVAVGQDANSNATIQYSADGSNWLIAQGAKFSGVGQSVSWGNSLWIAVGSDTTINNTIKYSSDGITWSNALGTGFTVQGNSVKWNGSLWVASGQSALGSLLYSYNGSNWFTAPQTGYSSNMTAARWNGTYWLAAGSATVGNNQFSISSDGINWRNIQTSISINVNAIHWNGIYWIATIVGAGPIYYSYDGLKWLTASNSFSINGFDSDWNGSYWIAVGQDANNLNSIQKSTDGINWINSTSNNFTGGVQNISYSSNLTPAYSQDNFRIISQNIPNFGVSTNSLLVTPNALIFNDMLYLDAYTNRVGINCNAPSYDLDVYGSVNVSSTVYAGRFSGDGSLLTNLNALSTSALTSTIIGLGTFGYISTPLTSLDFSSIAASSFFLLNSNYLTSSLVSTATNLLSRINLTSSVFISTSFSTLNAYTINASTLTTSSLVASTVLTSNIYASSASIQYGNINALSTLDAKAQRLIVSSLRFYDGDGTIFIADQQSSNISAIAMYTSSMAMNSLLTSNIRVGNNSNLSPITFYGVRGTYNNTAILEQSTSLSTQELLFFRGSSIGDQVRIQTTGGFRVETGVSGRLFPNTAQLSTTAFAIDAFSNVTMNNSTFYLNAASSFVGINCNTPGVALDVAGTIRGSQLIFSTITTSTFATSSATISSLTVPLLTTQRLLVSSLRFYDGDGITLIPDVQSSNVSTIALYASSVTTGFLQTYSLLSTPAIVTSSLTINAMVLSTISTQILGVNSLLVSSAKISTLTAPTLVTQTLLVSSLRFYDGDGTIFIADQQSSNVSTLALYTSTVLANTVTTSNIRLGFNQSQTPISFYGMRGGYNNTVIAEQSTGVTTQELLLFRGSSISDQVRIQTTGAFRVETGVTSRVFPNVGQLTTPPLLIDALSNVAINNSNIYVLAANNYVGINCNTPGVALDVNGVIRGNGSLISNINYGFLAAMSTSSLVVSSITANNAYFSTLTLSSILQTNTLTASTISTQSLVTGTFSVSSFSISTMTPAFVRAQAMTTSSLAFYTGDGLINIPDLQGSNVSTGALYASSITAPIIATANMRVGSNTVQNSINFYGRTGAFNNTVIAEMSTGTVSQELLIFKGSSPSDQVRIQTTGAFRVETGVSARLFSNVSSNATAPLFIDALSNVSMNGSNIYVLAANNFVGINCNTPGVALDVNGTLRATNAVLSNITFVTINTNSMNVSTALVSSVLGVNTAYFSTTIASTMYMNTFSSIYQVDFQSAIANFSSLSKVNISPAVQNIWVAAGNGTNSLAYSLDGITWSGIATSAATFSVGGSNVAWNGARFVAVGQGTNSICYSANGSNWVAIPNGSTTFTTGAAAIAWNGSRFIAGGAGTNALSYSADGINWTGIALGATTFTSQTNGIAWNGKIWVAVGAGTNSIIYSADGLTWTGIASGATTFSVGGFGIAWNGKVWVAVGNGTNSICYSVNGINWTPISNTQITTFTTQGFGVAWNGIRFVAVGQGTNTIIYSADGINWLPVPSSTSIFSSNGQNIAWNGIRWVAMGFGINSFAYSADGINWTGIATGSSAFTNAGIGVGYSSNVFAAYAQQTLDMLPQNIPTFFRSTNQIFNSLSSMLINDTLAIDRTYNYVGVNCNAPLYNLDVAGVANMSTFTKVNVQPYAVARWVAGGQGTNSIAYSADGINWTGITGPFTATNGVAWNGVRWVAVGTGGVYAIAYSPDGINWTGIPVSVNTFTTGGRSVAWNNRVWVATGNGTNAISYSSDGINWTGIPLSTNTFTSAGTAIAWNGLLWVATGNGTNSIAYSTDGFNWTGIPSSANTFTSGGNGIAWNGIRWVAVGNGTNAIAYSPDGINWTGIPYSSNTFTSTGFGSGIAWNGFRWVAVGNGTNIFAYSPDGINWTGIPGSSSSFTTYGVGIAWNGVRWVAVGQGTNTIAYSPDGINWSPVTGSTSIFTVYGVFVGYSSNVAPAYQQQNLDILSQNIPTFFRSTNQMFLANSTMLLNDTLIVDRAFKNVGINCNVPTVTLDVGGTIRAPTAIFSTLNASTMNISSGTISSLTVPTFTTQRLLVSSLRFFDGDGTTFIADHQGSNVSTIGMWASSIITNAVTAFNFISAPVHLASTVITNSLVTSSLSTQTLITSNFITSSATIASLTAPTFTAQRLLISSLRFYDGDGYVQMPDMQGSNVSTIAIYGSSITVNTLLSYNYVSTANVYTSAMSAVYINTNTISTANFQTSTFFAQFNSTSVLNANAASFSSINVSTLNVPILATQKLFVSSLRFYDGDGTTFIADAQASNVSTIGLYASSMITNAITAFNFISAPLHTASTVITNFMLASSISTQNLVTSNLFTSSATFSTLTVPLVTTQRLLLSSARFYDGDGFVGMPDVQNSNVSTGALYASSVTTVALASSNIRLGSNAVQTPINFFGLTGAFNNTLIAEQSTSITSQELLFFRGSSISDQFRFQTTGGFRVETGVTGRLFPNTGQLPYATFQVDPFSNVSMNSNQFYLNAASGFIGINTATPAFQLDVTGSMRVTNILTSSMNISSLVTSTQTTAALTVQRLAVSSLRFFDGDGTTFIADAQASNVSTIGLWASSIITNAVTAFNFISAPVHLASTMVTNSLVTSSLSTQTLITSNLITSSATIAALTVPTFTAQRLLVSSLRFYDGDGYVQMPDMQGSNVSTIALYGSSITVNTLIATSFISTTSMSVSSLTINNLLVNNTISTTTFYASSFYSQLNSTSILNVNAGTFSSIIVSTVNAPILTAQRFLVSSLRFYDGDGITFIPDIQGSNVSTMAVYASSFTTNNIVAQNANVQYMYASSISTLNVITTTLTTTNISSVNMYISSLVSANTINVNFGNFSSVAISTLNVPILTAQRFQVSSLRFFDGDGTTFIADMQGSNVSTMALYGSTIAVNALTAYNYVSTQNLFVSSMTINNLTVNNTISTTTFYASSFYSQLNSTGILNVNAGNFSTLLVSTMNVPSLTTQRLQVSSLRFFDGDGVTVIRDLQSSNVSSIAMYTSSLYGITGVFGNAISINNPTPLFNLDVNGNARISSLTIGDTAAGAFTSTNTTFQLAVFGTNGPARVGGTTWTQISDRRLKEKIVDADLDRCYEDIKALPLRRFTYTSSFFNTIALPDRNVLGFIAQEVKELHPKAITVADGFGVSDLNWLNIDQMNMSLYGAVKRMMQTNEELTSSVAGLQTTLGYCMSTITGGNV